MSEMLNNFEYCDKKEANHVKLNKEKVKEYAENQLMIMIQVVLSVLIIVFFVLLRDFNVSIYQYMKDWYIENINDSLLLGNSISDYKDTIDVVYNKVKNNYFYGATYNNYHDYSKELIMSVEPTLPLSTGVITSTFGKRESPFNDREEFHYGLDISSEANSDIYTIFPGIVEKLDENSSYGKYIIVDHGKGIKTLYAHCNSIDVNVGDNVGYGDLIAHVGNSGRTTGNHLHIELIINGRRYDPNLIFKDAYTYVL